MVPFIRLILEQIDSMKLLE